MTVKALEHQFLLHAAAKRGISCRSYLSCTAFLKTCGREIALQMSWYLILSISSQSLPHHVSSRSIGYLAQHMFCTSHGGLIPFMKFFYNPFCKSKSQADSQADHKVRELTVRCWFYRSIIHENSAATISNWWSKCSSGTLIHKSWWTSNFIAMGHWAENGPQLQDGQRDMKRYALTAEDAPDSCENTCVL